MTDKERVLMTIIKSFYIKYINSDIELLYRCNSSEIKIGDLVLAVTGKIHELQDFTIGYVVEINNEHDMTLREIGSNRICNISNELFYKIPIDLLIDKNYLLEGEKYKIYEKVLKAISKCDDYFHSIDFEDDLCIVRTRKAFSREVKNEYKFKYDSSTTVEEIVNLIKESRKNNFVKKFDTLKRKLTLKNDK